MNIFEIPDGYLQTYTIGSKTSHNMLEGDSNLRTKHWEKSGMGMAMVAEKPRALKIVAVCSKDIVKIVIGIYI